MRLAGGPSARRNAEQALADHADKLAIVEAYCTGDVRFPERLHLNLRWMALAREFLQLLHDWTLFVENETASWITTEDGGASARSLTLLESLAAGHLLFPRQPLPRP